MSATKRKQNTTDSEANIRQKRHKQATLTFVPHIAVAENVPPSVPHTIVTGNVPYERGCQPAYGLIPYIASREDERKLANDTEKVPLDRKPNYKTIGRELKYGVVSPREPGAADWLFNVDPILALVLDYTGPLLKWVVASASHDDDYRPSVSVSKMIGVFSSVEQAAYVALACAEDAWYVSAIDDGWFSGSTSGKSEAYNRLSATLITYTGSLTKYLSDAFPTDRKARDQCALDMFNEFTKILGTRDQGENTGRTSGVYVSIYEMPDTPADGYLSSSSESQIVNTTVTTEMNTNNTVSTVVA